MMDRRSNGSAVRALTDTHTDRQTDGTDSITSTASLTREVKILGHFMLFNHNTSELTSIRSDIPEDQFWPAMAYKELQICLFDLVQHA